MHENEINNLIIQWQFKALGHPILGIFGTDQMVVELTKISHYNSSKLQKNSNKTQECQEGAWMEKNWAGLKWVALGQI